MNCYNVPVLVFDLYDRIKYINTTFEKTFQVSKQKLLNQNGASFFGEESFKYYVQQNINKAGNGELVSQNYSLNIQNGSNQKMVLEYFPLFSEKKVERVLIFFKTNPDNESSHSLQTENHELVEILNSLDDVIFITKRNFEIIFLNTKGRAVFNKHNEPVIGKKCYELLHDNHFPPAACPILKHIKSDQLNQEATTFFENGHIIKVTPVFDQYGNLSSFLHHVTPNIKRKKEHNSMEELRHQTIEQEIHKFDDFKKRLSKKYPELTSYNLNHAILIRMNLSTKETARYFNVNPGSIQRDRVRLKKKLNLKEKEGLFNFLFHF